MCRTMAGPVFYLFAALLGLASLPTIAVAADGYDVSYVWSRNLDGVRDYRKRVAGVLGPVVAKDLKVVIRDSLIGLVYVRHGDSAGAARVAKSHSRLLRAQGLDAASPIRSENWTLVGDAGTRQVAVASNAESGSAASIIQTTAAAPPAATGSPRSRMTSTERTREIHNLESAVEDYIDRLRKDGKLDPDERTGWSVYDFTTGEKLVTINEDQQFQTASLVKPFIAAAFFYKVKRGELSYNRESRRQLERMIQHSSNSSANWVTRRVGGPKEVERILKRQYPAIFQEIHLVEYIPVGGKTYRNKASVHDYSRFLYALWKEEIAGAREIKRLMALPGRDRIYRAYGASRKTPRSTTRPAAPRVSVATWAS